MNERNQNLVNMNEVSNFVRSNKYLNVYDTLKP